MKKKNNNNFLYYSTIIGFILFIIVIIRASNTGITYDEAYTYLNYVKSNPFGVIKYLFTSDRILANNHLMNTFLISLFQRIFNIKYNVFIIRLPNILFYALYLIFSYKLANLYKHKYLFFNILVFNYGIHEFFGLARGYGIACCLVLMSIYYLKIWINSNNKNNLYLNVSYFLALISCYANTTCLLFFASILLFSQIYMFIKMGIKDNINYIKKNIFLIIFICIMTLLVIIYHFKVSDEGLPLYGSDSNFYSSVLVSVLEVYGVKKYAFIITTEILLSILIVFIAFKKKLMKYDIKCISLIYILLLVFMTLLFKQKWLTSRLLIPVMPLFSVSLFELIDIVRINNYYVRNLLTMMVVIPFVLNIDFTKTRDWDKDYIIESKSYEAYMETNNEIVREYLSNPTLKFYKEKILYYYNYDILEGIE